VFEVLISSVTPGGPVTAEFAPSAWVKVVEAMVVR
jgi:hypothetical protein